MYELLRKLQSLMWGKPVSDEALLALEQKRLIKLREAVKIEGQKQAVNKQLLAARKESKELEELLGRRSRFGWYVIGFGAFLVFVILVRGCIGC